MLAGSKRKKKRKPVAVCAKEKIKIRVLLRTVIPIIKDRILVKFTSCLLVFAYT